MPILKYEYMNRDFRRWAVVNNVETAMNPYDSNKRKRPFPFPVSSAKALRIALCIQDRDDLIRYSRCVFQAYWVDRKNIADKNVLREILVHLFGASRASQLVEASNSARQALRNNVDELIRRGGFGVPTVFINNEMYFGVDRMVFVEKEMGETHPSAVVSSRKGGGCSIMSKL